MRDLYPDRLLSIGERERRRAARPERSADRRLTTTEEGSDGGEDNRADAATEFITCFALPVIGLRRG